ncbi:MAG: PEP-utilizing enzyme [Ilumatobacteraceae bacterium]
MNNLNWNAPGPGHWALDRSHVNRPATLINQHVQEYGTARGTRRMFEELGAPLDALDLRFVNGMVYTRVRPLIRPDSPATSLPPKPLLRAMIRLHPEMRRRARSATVTTATRPWRRVAQEWSAPGGLRDQCTDSNLALQNVDRAALSDGQSIDHALDVIEHAKEMWVRHFWLHGYDLSPVGVLLFSTQQWGIAHADVIPLLEGASPSTSGPESVLRRIREAVDVSGRTPSTLDEMREVSAAIAADIDAFLQRRGALIFSRYDIDGLCLWEAPEVLFATIMAARDDSDRQRSAEVALARRIDVVRARVPADARPAFDQALEEARAAMDLRDDNGPHTVEWPLGLMRLAMLNIGHRLVAKGLLDRATDALELGVDEITAELFDGGGPGATELRRRAIWRETVDMSGAPRLLGAPEPIPPIEVLPADMARLVGFVQTVLAEAGMDGQEKASGLTGFGVGSGVYRGRACRADSPEDAVINLEEGDVLVVPCTTPAYNMILPLAGAIVTAEGGALSHAAVLARELGVPAVVGAPRAIDDIPHGAIIDVDADRGEVRIVQSSAS